MNFAIMIPLELKQLTFKFLCTTLFLGANLVCAASSIDGLDTLNTLLTELRELREVKYEVINSWNHEKQQVELLTILEEEKVAELQQEVLVLEQQKNDLSLKKQSLTDENQSYLQDIEAIRQWINRSCRHILEHIDDKQILFDTKSIEQLHGLLADELSVTDKFVTFLNLLQNTATDGTQSAHSIRVISVDSEKYSADVLRIGGVLEYFVTPDDQTCGIRIATDSPHEWRILESDHAPWIRKAIRVLNKDIPAELITVPVPLPSQ